MYWAYESPAVGAVSHRGGERLASRGRLAVSLPFCRRPLQEWQRSTQKARRGPQTGARGCTCRAEALQPAASTAEVPPVISSREACGGGEFGKSA